MTGLKHVHPKYLAYKCPALVRPSLSVLKRVLVFRLTFLVVRASRGDKTFRMDRFKLCMTVIPVFVVIALFACEELCALSLAVALPL